MVRWNSRDMSQRRLLVFKWLMILLPPIAIMLGHTLLGYLLGYSRGHSILELTRGRLAETLLLAILALVVAYVFAETTFRVVQRLQAEAFAREQDVQTMNAVMQERARLSRELHDGVAQLVADLLIRLDTIKELVEADRLQEADAELERLHGVADELYQDIEESIAGLRTDVMEEGLIRALEAHLEKFEERHQISTSLRSDSSAQHLSPLAALQVFRLIQEALTNVRKHAAAREATVTLTRSGPDHLTVMIDDDGQGFVPDEGEDSVTRALGLRTMQERVEALDGTLHVNSRPGSGTQVVATVPLSRPFRENTYGALANSPG